MVFETQEEEQELLDKEKILINRNKVFFNRAHELSKNNRLFIAVGASHLGGSNGLLKQFELAGYKLNALR